MSGDKRARRWLIAQGETAGSLSNNFYDVVKDVALNNFPGIGYPGLFLTQTQQGATPPKTVTVGYGGGWLLDYSHLPTLPIGP